jgi:ATP-dependent RNA helicase RhlE
MTFQSSGLIEPIVRAVAAEGYAAPTPIQTKAIPHVLAGRDLLGCAQTGTGKTGAFALPILQRLAASTTSSAAKRRAVRALVLCPTRELALQIEESFRVYGRNLPLRRAAIFGGVNQFHQVRALQEGVDILIATPGRLLDLMGQRHVDLRSVEVFVLDEADRMLDMGFIADIRRIVKQVPAKRQTLLFSATMPPEIRGLADSLLNNPVRVEAARVGSTAERINQSVYHVQKRDKAALLAHLIERGDMGRTLVFTRTKHGADRVARDLSRRGIHASAIHGNKSQNARVRALASFKSQEPPILVATDIASRGIDVDEITHVINFDLPDVPETYVHRIGRTARAGASGTAVSFCDHEERDNLRQIERLIGHAIDVCADLPRLERTEAEPAAPRASGRHPQPRAPRREESRKHHQHGNQQRSRSDGRPHANHSGNAGAPRGQRSQRAPHGESSARQHSGGHRSHATPAGTQGHGAPPGRPGFIQRGRGRSRGRGAGFSGGAAPRGRR